MVAQIKAGISLSQTVAKDVSFHKATLSVSPARPLNLQSYRLQADQDVGIESLSSLYNDIDQAPFGPYIDLSFEALGQSYSFQSVPLSNSMSVPKYVVYGQNNEILSSSRLPLTTYSTTFTESDGSESLLVASLNVLDQSVYTQIVRSGKPAVATHTLKLAKLGFAGAPTLLSKLSEFETLEDSTDDSSEAESYISYLVEGSQGDFCGSDHINHHTVDPINKSDRALQGLHVFSSCLTNSNLKSYAYNAGVIIDYSTYKYYEPNTSAFNSFLAAVFAINSNVYYRQMRVQWAVREIRVLTSVTSDTSTWNANEGECKDMSEQLINFTTWGKTNLSSQYGSWQLYTICNSNQYGTVGIAWVGGLCSSSYYFSVSKPYISSGVNTIGHEVGHNFGSSHAWDLVEGSVMSGVGGIMDYYTDGRLLSNDTDSPGEYGFHSSSEPEICEILNSKITSANVGDSTKCFTETSVGDANPVCGNGIIEDGEECELGYGDQPGSSSSCCNNCKLVENANCSVESDCCVNCQIQKATTCSTPTGETGLCGFGPVGPDCIKVSFSNVSEECSSYEAYSTECVAKCNTSSNIYTFNMNDYSVCSYTGETVSNSGICIDNTCQSSYSGYKWVSGVKSDVCICEDGQTEGYYSQTIYCINNRSDIVHSVYCDPNEKPSLTSCSACESTTDDSTTEDSTTEDSTTEDSTTEDSTTEDSTTEDSTTEDSTTEDSTTEDSTTEDSTTEDSTTEDSTTEDSTTEDSTTEDSTTEDSTTDDTTTDTTSGVSSYGTSFIVGLHIALISILLFAF